MKRVHGGNVYAFESEYGRKPLDFSANVSPLGLPQGVRKAILDSLDEADRYPDPNCSKLCEALGDFHGISEEQILCGCGAADLIDRFIQTLRPKKAVLPAPTFSEYEISLSRIGCELDRVSLSQEQNFRVQETILSHLTEDVDLLILVEPGNPAGVTTDISLLQKIVEVCQEKQIYLLVDECFNSFLAKPEEHTLLPLLKEQQPDHLLLLKAFTKGYGMAGIRLGYGISANRSLLAEMKLAGQPWSVSTMAQAAGVAALKETDYTRELRALIETQRPVLKDALEALGFQVIPGEANYLLFHTEVEDLDQRLRTQGILIRNCSMYSGLGPGWFRIAVLREEDNQRLIETLKKEIPSWQK